MAQHNTMHHQCSQCVHARVHELLATTEAYGQTIYDTAPGGCLHPNVSFGSEESDKTFNRRILNLQSLNILPRRHMHVYMHVYMHMCGD